MPAALKTYGDKKLIDDTDGNHHQELCQFEKEPRILSAEMEIVSDHQETLNHPLKMAKRLRKLMRDTDIDTIYKLCAISQQYSQSPNEWYQ